MKKTVYKGKGSIELFYQDESAAKLSKLGNPLEKLGNVINFEMFRNTLEASMLNHNKKSNAGCRPYDVVLMFKILLLKRFYNLSDEQTEYQIKNTKSIRTSIRFYNQ